MEPVLCLERLVSGVQAPMRAKYSNAIIYCALYGTPSQFGAPHSLFNSKKVKFIFFQNLNTMQEEEGLKLGNKLSSQH